jgi:hypothetical protein
MRGTWEIQYNINTFKKFKNTDPKLMKTQTSAVKNALQVLSSCGAMVEAVETRVPCNSFQLVFTKSTD